MGQRLGARKIGARVPGDEALSDFLAVLDIIRGDESIEAWEDWLDEFPASPKREAVLFRWCNADRPRATHACWRRGLLLAGIACALGLQANPRETQRSAQS